VLYQCAFTYAGLSAALHKEDIFIILISESLTFGLQLSKSPTPAPASENERTVCSEEDVILVTTENRERLCKDLEVPQYQPVPTRTITLC
jgi:hypothetical protein